MGSTLQRAAAVLIIGGVLVLAGYAAYAILAALFRSEVPIAISLAVSAITAGFAILLLYVLVDRIRASRSERFEEVD